MKSLDRNFVIPVVVVFILGIFQANCDFCNPLQCIYFYDNLFTQSADYGPCLKLKKFKQCLSNCLPLFSMNVADFNSGLEKVVNTVCQDEEEYNDSRDFWYKKCVQRKKVQMLNCMYSAWISEPEEPDMLNKSIFHCRKIEDVQRCPDDILVCKDETVNYVEELLSKFFETIKEVACYSHSMSDIWGVKVQYVSDDVALGRCFDMYSKEAMSCLPANWTVVNFLSNHRRYNELCLAINEYFKCLHRVVDKVCANNKEVIMQSLNSFNKTIQRAFQAHCDAYHTSTTTENIGSHLVLTPHSNNDVEYVSNVSESKVRYTEFHIFHYYGINHSCPVQSISVIFLLSLFVCFVLS